MIARQARTRIVVFGGLLGCTLLFVGPSLILFSVRLVAVGSAWFALWLLYFLFVIRYVPKVQTAPRSPI